MKTTSATNPTSVTLNAVLQTPVQVQDHRIVLFPNHDKVELLLCTVNGRVTLRHEAQSLCSELLGIAGIGILLYSAGMFLHPSYQAGFPTTDALPALTTLDLSPENGELLP
jgi:hypothetical protein